MSSNNRPLGPRCVVLGPSTLDRAEQRVRTEDHSSLLGMLSSRDIPSPFELLLHDTPCPVTSFGYCAVCGSGGGSSDGHCHRTNRLCAKCRMVAYCGPECLSSTDAAQEPHEKVCSIFQALGGGLSKTSQAGNGNDASDEDDDFHTLPCTVKSAFRVVIEDYVFGRTNKFVDETIPLPMVEEEEEDGHRDKSESGRGDGNVGLVSQQSLKDCIDHFHKRLPQTIQSHCTKQDVHRAALALSSSNSALGRNSTTIHTSEHLRYISRFNHSCLPNGRIHNDGDQENSNNRSGGSVFATRPIAEGEEVCLRYLSESANRLPCYARESLLQQHFGFGTEGCRCIACHKISPLSLAPATPSSCYSVTAQWIEGLKFGILCPSKCCSDHPLIAVCKQLAESPIDFDANKDAALAIRAMLWAVIAEQEEEKLKPHSNETSNEMGHTDQTPEEDEDPFFEDTTPHHPSISSTMTSTNPKTGRKYDNLGRPPLFVPTHTANGATDVFCCRCQGSMRELYGPSGGCGEKHGDERLSHPNSVRIFARSGKKEENNSSYPVHHVHPNAVGNVWGRVEQWLAERNSIYAAMASLLDDEEKKHHIIQDQKPDERANDDDDDDDDDDDENQILMRNKRNLVVLAKPVMGWARMALDGSSQGGGGVRGPTASIDPTGKPLTATRGDWFVVQQPPSDGLPSTPLTPIAVAATLLAMGIPPTNVHYNSAQLRLGHLRRIRQEGAAAVNAAYVLTLPYDVTFSEVGGADGGLRHFYNAPAPPPITVKKKELIQELHVSSCKAQRTNFEKWMAIGMETNGTATRSTTTMTESAFMLHEKLQLRQALFQLTMDT